MQPSEKRVTLVATHNMRPYAEWNETHPGGEVTFVDSVHAVKFALGNALSEDGLDVERVIIDRTGAAEEFLELLARMPQQFAGDLLFIREQGDGFLSATGRGGDRVVYALGANDIRFYLETHHLVTGRPALRLVV